MKTSYVFYTLKSPGMNHVNLPYREAAFTTGGGGHKIGPFFFVKNVFLQFVSKNIPSLKVEF